MKERNLKNKFLNPNCTLGFIDGLDISLFLSLLPYISYYYFNELKDNDFLFLSLSLVVCSYFIRPFALKILFFIKKRLKVECEKILSFKNCFIYIIPFTYLSCFLVPNFNNNILLNVLILFSIRIIIGIVFALNYNFLSDYTVKNPSFMNVKKFVFKFLGIMFGLLFVEFLNQIYSNNELNSWYWKISLLILIVISIFHFYINKDYKEENFLIGLIIDSNNKASDITNLIRLFLGNLFFILPILFLMMIILQTWLPGIVRPENSFFIQFKLSHILLFLLLMFCFHFVFQLIGKEKIVTYFSFFNILLCLIYFFFVELSSSYGINFFQFYLSVISACALPLSFHIRNNNVKQLFLSYNLFYMINSVLIMGIVYYLIYYKLNYDFVYLIIFFIFTLNILFKRLKLG